MKVTVVAHFPLSYTGPRMKQHDMDIEPTMLVREFKQKVLLLKIHAHNIKIMIKFWNIFEHHNLLTDLFLQFSQIQNIDPELQTICLGGKVLSRTHKTTKLRIKWNTRIQPSL